MTLRQLLHPIRTRREFVARHDLTRVAWLPTWFVTRRDWPPEVRR